MTLSYILNFDQLFVQRNPAIGPMTGGRDPYVERLTQAYQEFSDRKDTLKIPELWISDIFHSDFCFAEYVGHEA